MAMGFTQADLDALKAALVSGTLTVSIGDRTVTYRSQKDLIEAIKMVQAELSPPSSNPSIVKATYSRGGS